MLPDDESGVLIAVQRIVGREQLDEQLGARLCFMSKPGLRARAQGRVRSGVAYAFRYSPSSCPGQRTCSVPPSTTSWARYGDLICGCQCARRLGAPGVAGGEQGSKADARKVLLYLSYAR